MNTMSTASLTTLERWGGDIRTMAEFDFYGTWEDSYVQLDRLAHLSRFILVVDMDYEEPVVLQSRILSEDFMAVVKQRPHLYLYSDEYSRFPAGFHTSGRGFMWIDPHISGPALLLDLPICRQLEASLQLFARQPLLSDLISRPRRLESGIGRRRRFGKATMRCGGYCGEAWLGGLFVLAAWQTV